MKKSIAEIKGPSKATYGTGKRKSAIARVWLFEGNGTIVVNKQSVLEYLKSDILAAKVIEPLIHLGIEKKYNIKATVIGGGLVGQSDALRLGVARALLDLNSEFRVQLKPEGFLTRDPRVKERKKYGKRGARKGAQYRKR